MANVGVVAGRCLARENELQRLLEYLDEGLTGNRSACFVIGEAGAGKTALLAEFCNHARQAHPNIVIADGMCNAQTGSGDAYLPFREVLTELTGEADEASLSPGSPDSQSPGTARWFQAAKRTLVEHGPDLIDIFVPGGAVVTRLSAQAARGTRWGKNFGSQKSADIATSRLDQSHICEQYTNVLRQLAQRQALVIIVDDLHWADNASIDLLFHLSRRLVADPVLIIGAYRPEDLVAGRDRDRHPLDTALNEIKRYQGEIDVAIGADETSGKSFIDELLDSEPNRLDERFRESLLAHTDGNALFTVELLRHLKQRGQLALNDGGEWAAASGIAWSDLPARVEGVLSERLARLDDSERELLSIAAVSGGSFLAEVLSEATGLPLREIVRNLSGPVAREYRLVRPQGIQHVAGVRVSAYDFRHNLFQQYLYEAQDEVERVHCHELLGLSIEKIFAADPAAVALQLARHFAAAEHTEKAVHYLLIAAERAYGAYAIDEAETHAERALDLINERDCKGAGATDDWVRRDSLRLYRLLGWVYDRQCDYERARRSFDNALSLTDDDDTIERALLLRALATCWEHESEHDRASAMLDEALNVLGESADVISAECMNEWLAVRIGQLWSAYWMGDIALMERLIEDVEPLVDRHADAVERRRFASGQAMLGYRKERYLLSGDTVAAADRALAASKETESLHEQADATFAAGFARIFADQSEAAVEYFLGGISLAEKCGDLRLKGRALTYLTVAYRQMEQIELLEETIALARDAVESSTAHDYEAVALANQSWIAWKSGQLDGAVALAEQALELWQREAPDYPLQWLAKFQLVAVFLERDNVQRAIEYGRSLLGSTNAILGNGVTEELERSVAAFDAGDTDAAGRSLKTAIKLAGDAGYL